MKSNNVVALFKRAWKSLRFHYPNLAVTLQNGLWVYVIADENSIEKWLEESFVIESTSVTAETVVGTGIPIMPTLHYLPGTSEIILNGSHSYLDGLGALQILARFFELMSEDISPTFGDEDKNLLPSVEAAAGCPDQSTVEMETFAKESLENFSKLPSVGLSYKGDASTRPGISGCLVHTFSQKASDALVRSCKKKDISVTSATVAAIAVVSYMVASDSEMKSRN